MARETVCITFEIEGDVEDIRIARKLLEKDLALVGRIRDAVDESLGNHRYYLTRSYMEFQ